MTTDASQDEITRYTLKIRTAHQDKLAKLAKQFKISQSEILEAMLDHVDMEKMAPIFTKIRTDKVVGREQKKELIRKLSKLKPAELAKLVGE